ncbi:MAG: TetR/AcrR family transcriptional regulator [Candidatus Hydrogenedentes bacterium]|jgi:AcrR family transcriptional regulator|nr:TetR/AcrR family transcriptional regulator [Candidatus Hydrogenedentota bacterium]
MVERSTEKALEKRRLLIIDTARELFLTHGFHEVKIDTIAAISGVSKKTIYRLYNNLETLTAHGIKRDFDCWWEWFFDATLENKQESDISLEFFYNVLEHWIKGAGFKGLLFARALFNTEALGEEVAVLVKECTKKLRQFIYAEARKAGVKKPGRFSHVQVGLLLLMLGQPGSNKNQNCAPNVNDLRRIYTLWQ